MNLEFFAIAPEIPDLVFVDDELGFVSQFFPLYPQPPLTGVVNAADIEHEVNRFTSAGNIADVLLLASHADNSGIVVSDGYVNEDHISSWCERLGCSLLILSVCNGERIAKRVRRRVGCAALYCRVDVPDRDAMLYTARFVAALAQADSYSEAFALAGSNGGQYVLVGGDMMSGQGAISRLSNSVSELTINLQSVTANVRSVTEDFKEFRSEVIKLRIEITALNAQVENMKKSNAILPEPTIKPLWAYVFFALLILLVVGVWAGRIQ